MYTFPMQRLLLSYPMVITTTMLPNSHHITMMALLSYPMVITTTMLPNSHHITMMALLSYPMVITTTMLPNNHHITMMALLSYPMVITTINLHCWYQMNLKDHHCSTMTVIRPRTPVSTEMVVAYIQTSSLQLYY